MLDVMVGFRDVMMLLRGCVRCREVAWHDVRGWPRGFREVGWPMSTFGFSSLI